MSLDAGHAGTLDRRYSPHKDIIIKPTNPPSNFGEHLSVRMVSGQSIIMRESAIIPSDFKKLTKADVLVGSVVSGTIKWNIQTNYAKIGSESYHNVSGSVSSGSTTIKMDVVEELSFMAAISGVDAGDKIGIKFTRHSGDGLISDVHYLGMRMQYKW